MSHKKQRLFYLTPAILLVTILLLGIFLRFGNLGQKVFWVDEVATAVRVSGYTIPQVTSELAQQDIFDKDRLLSYQTISPDKTFKDTIAALTKSPEHAPLYFILTRLWMQLWGNSITVIRSLSAFISLLVFPCLYWLCQELFAIPFVSWLAIGLIGISPFYIAYAQEARPYSLWTVTILLTSAAFLRAVRLNRKQSWLLYCLCLIISFYTSLFSIYIAIFQGIYLLISSNKIKFKLIKNYLIYSGIATLAFSPWILVIFNHLDLLQENTSWMRGNFNWADITAVFIGANLLIFGDLPISQNSNPIQIAVILIIFVVAVLTALKIYQRYQSKLLKLALLLTFVSSIIIVSSYIYLDWITIIGALVAICILSLSIYSLYYLIANTRRDRWGLILSLMLSLPVPLVLIDIINQGQGSTAPRYLIPLQLGILIAVSYTLASKLTISKQPQLWKLTIIAFLMLGSLSNIRNFNLSPFYQKGRNINNIAIAKIINQSHTALLIVEADEAMDVISLAYSLNPAVKYKVINSETNLSKYIRSFENTYLLKPSPKLLQKLQENSQLNLNKLYKSHVFSADEFPLDLWGIKIKNN